MKTVKNITKVMVAIIGLLVIMATTPADAKTPTWLAITPGTKLVVMGGTDDPDAKDQLKRVADWAPPEDISTVSYPAAFKPYLGDYTYDESVEIGKQKLTEKITDESNGDSVVVVSLSQGARVVGDTASDMDTPENTGKATFVSMGDPRFPQTGAEVVYHDTPINGYVSPQGERPATEHVEHVSVCIKGDPLCSGYYGPVDAGFGFFCTHSGGCPGIDYHYGNTENLEIAASRQEGATTYILLDAPHPGVQIAEANGLTVAPEQEVIMEQVLPIAAPQL